MEIKIGDLTDPAVMALLQAHHQDMLKHSPEESVHVLDLSSLSAEDVTFWTVWIDSNLAGCGALKQLNKLEGEIKSMRTASTHLRKGVAGRLLDHLMLHAQQFGLQQISLETGTATVFEPALQLYKRAGFVSCDPFSDYKEDPYSQFMTLKL